MQYLLTGLHQRSGGDRRIGNRRGFNHNAQGAKARRDPGKAGIY
jgi:hypothetical protein